MQTQQNLSELQFVNLHVVDKNYHERHSQLLHKHEDVLELFYIMQGDGQYIVGGKEYIIRPGKSQNLLMNTELPIGTISVRMALDAVNKSLKEGRPVKISEVDV